MEGGEGRSHTEKGDDMCDTLSTNHSRGYVDVLVDPAASLFLRITQWKQIQFFPRPHRVGDWVAFKDENKPDGRVSCSTDADILVSVSPPLNHPLGSLSLAPSATISQHVMYTLKHTHLPSSLTPPWKKKNRNEVLTSQTGENPLSIQSCTHTCTHINMSSGFPKLTNCMNATLRSATGGTM